jgi:opacity protein-like surface antigen
MPIIRLRLAATLLAAVACVSATPAALADGMPYPRGSVKDAPVVVPSAGPCYFRTDVGYSWSRDPDVRWTVTDPNPGPTQFQFVTDRVTKVSTDNSWFGEVGLGCGSGPHGVRGELVYGYHGKRNVSGEPGHWTVLPGVDPLHTAVTTHTLMFNAYYDLGRWMDRFVPYVGAGVGTAYNIAEEVYFTGNPALINRISGDERWSLAWSLMAGVGWQVSERVVLDFGYRYLDMGKAESGHVDNAGFWNPKVRLDDLAAHEFKFGLRFALGGAPCCTFLK